jgi:hypothetical protein
MYFIINTPWVFFIKLDNMNQYLYRRPILISRQPGPHLQQSQAKYK